MQYLAVRDFDQLQHYKDRNPPWIKLYYALLDDPAFLALDEVHQGWLMKLLLVAGRCDNRIPNDPVYLRKVLRTDAEIDLTPLIDAGFLLVPRKRPARSEERTEPACEHNRLEGRSVRRAVSRRNTGRSRLCAH